MFQSADESKGFLVQTPKYVFVGWIWVAILISFVRTGTRLHDFSLSLPFSLSLRPRPRPALHSPLHVAGLGGEDGRVPTSWGPGGWGRTRSGGETTHGRARHGGGKGDWGQNNKQVMSEVGSYRWRCLTLSGDLGSSGGAGEDRQPQLPVLSVAHPLEVQQDAAHRF